MKACRGRQTRRWRAVVWELLGGILHANAIGDRALRDDRMTQLAILTKADWYVRRRTLTKETPC